MEIKVSGNKDFYQTNRAFSLLEISISGDFSLERRETPITLRYGDMVLNMGTSSRFYSFTQNVKGLSEGGLAIALQEFNQERGFTDSFFLKNALELNLFKAALLIYGWIEFAISNSNIEELKKRIYNDFIIDYSGKPEPQKDVYFISEKFIKSDYTQLLNRLVEVNLLDKGCFIIGGIQLESYFLPLVRPGVSRHLFNHPADTDGEKTYSLWKQILNDRDSRIRTWMHNRF